MTFPPHCYQHCKFLDVLRFTSLTLPSSLSLSDFPSSSSSDAPFPRPLSLPFLTELSASSVRVPAHGREFFKFLLGGCPDIEQLHLVNFRKTFASNKKNLLLAKIIFLFACIASAASFVLAADKLFILHFFLSSFQTFSGDTAFYFSDFLLDDVLGRNPLGRLERFVVSNVSLTLISALRLISSRPKLRTVGRLLGWDVQVGKHSTRCFVVKVRFRSFLPKQNGELQTFAQILRRAAGLKLLQDITIF